MIANLADNGLAAALRARNAGGRARRASRGASSASSASGEPFLSLRSSVRQGHLVIEAKNSISEADRVAWEESAKRSRKRQRTWDEAHGWGLSIISGIAQRHGGSLECAIEDGVFRATVIMRLGSASDAAARGEAERTLPIAQLARMIWSWPEACCDAGASSRWMTAEASGSGDGELRGFSGLLSSR